MLLTYILSLLAISYLTFFPEYRDTYIYIHIVLLLNQKQYIFINLS